MTLQLPAGSENSLTIERRVTAHQRNLVALEIVEFLRCW